MLLCKELICLLLVGCTISVHGWDSDELAIFDLVEEINRNFYEVMNVTQEATGTDVKRAFRGLSIVLHPDKNPSPDANIQFRNLVSIYEVLKDPAKREKYDKVLRDGLPNWKSALYYYRRMRKVGLYEGTFIVFVIITIGQYLYAWASYIERKFTAEQVIGPKLKKLQKKNKNFNIDAVINEIPLPSILNTLPFQIPVMIWNSPKTVKNMFLHMNEMRQEAAEKRQMEAEAAKEQEELEKEIEEQARQKKENKLNVRRRKQDEKVPEKTDEDLRGFSKILQLQQHADNSVRPSVRKNVPSGGFWTDEDLTELVRLVKKYPAGCSSRWMTIAEALNRSVEEVTFMAAKMKENGYRLPNETDQNPTKYDAPLEIVKKEKTKKMCNDNQIIIPETNWSQEQQRALETAIVKYPKSTSSDRWQKIANCVPGKTKHECLSRFKYLCDIVKTQKQQESSQEQDDQEVADKAEDKLDNVEDDAATEEPEVEEIKPQQKRSKREERRRRKNMSSDDEDSDDMYQYQQS